MDTTESGANGSSSWRPALLWAHRFVWLQNGLAKSTHLNSRHSHGRNRLSQASGLCGLTIRSSRARFAASCKFLQVSLAQGRKAARLNSGVSAHVQFLRLRRWS